MDTMVLWHHYSESPFLGYWCDIEPLCMGSKRNKRPIITFWNTMNRFQSVVKLCPFVYRRKKLFRCISALWRFDSMGWKVWKMNPKSHYAKIGSRKKEEVQSVGRKIRKSELKNRKSIPRRQRTSSTSTCSWVETVEWALSRAQAI